MMKEEAIKKLREQLRGVEADIDRIVLSGGRIGYGDPLVREAHAIRTKIGKLVKPELPGVRVRKSSSR